MASTIKLKNGSGAPTTGDLVQGEPALDLTNKRLYTENASGVVIEVGTNPSALTIGGTALTATATELNVLDGITATTAELNYTDGVTSNIQTQLNTKAPIASPTFTGTATIPTADINAGTIDGTVIGGSTAAAGTFTTGQFNTSLNVTGTVTADGLTVDGTGVQANLLSTNASENYLYMKNTEGSAYIGQDAGVLQFWSGGNTGGVGAEVALKIDGNGDISFYEDTGTTAKFFWDASAESLGIGTSSPNSYANFTTLTLDGTTGSEIDLESGAVKRGALYAIATEVGLQTSSATNLPLTFGTNGTERMRIDSSGNLLVGTTNEFPYASDTITGFKVFSNGTVTTSASATSAILNTLNDGTIVDLRKDGTTVGSIGAKGGDVYLAQPTGGGIKVNSTSEIVPCGNSGIASDGTHDLGKSSARFKDLYLSGGVYLGGTGAANHLDDYEEGTWTPVLSDGTNNATASTAVGTYTKIGRMVHVKGTLIISSLGSIAGSLLFITGLPFTTSSAANTSASANFGYGQGLNLPVGTSLAGYLNTGNTRIVVQSWDAVAGTTNTTPAEWSADGGAYFDATYYI